MSGARKYLLFNNERGSLMAYMLVISLVASISATAMLIMSTSQARQGALMRNRTRAQYIAEAALVKAREKLWSNPAYAGGLETLLVGGSTVDVNITVLDACVAPLPPGCGKRRILAKVPY